MHSNMHLVYFKMYFETNIEYVLHIHVQFYSCCLHTLCSLVKRHTSNIYLRGVEGKSMLTLCFFASLLSYSDCYDVRQGKSHPQC